MGKRKKGDDKLKKLKAYRLSPEALKVIEEVKRMLIEKKKLEGKSVIGGAVTETMIVEMLIVEGAKKRIKELQEEIVKLKKAKEKDSGKTDDAITKIVLDYENAEKYGWMPVM